MGAKTEKQIIEERRQKADAILRAKNLSRKDGKPEEFPLTIENLVNVPEQFEDWPAHFLLPDGGKAALPFTQHGNYLLIRVDLAQPTTTIEAEVKSIIRKYKKGIPLLHPSSHYPGDLEFAIYRMKKGGEKRAEIARKLEKELSKAGLGSERGRLEFIDRAIKKVVSFIGAGP